jgi:exodeoxyribonuclease V alpha subunit
LTEVFRQAAASKIITSAHLIRQGKMPEFHNPEPGSDFHFVESDTPEDIAATLMRLVQERIPKGQGLDPIRDIQVLCPMKPRIDRSARVEFGTPASLEPSPPR